MTPYYKDAFATIYHGDCRTIVPALGLTVDAVLADPPYGDTSLEWDRWPTGWIASLDFVRTSQLWCFGSMRMFLEHGDEFRQSGWSFGQDIVWRKHNGSGFAADRFKRVHEHVLHFYRGAWGNLRISPVFTADAVKKQVRKKGRPTHTGHIDATPYTSEDGGPRLQRSVIEVRSCHGYAEHPTQKPTGIIAPLIAYSVPDGGLVLDPMMGAGSALRGAKDQGRGLRGIGIEMDERYCEIAAKRLAQEVLDFGGVA